LLQESIDLVSPTERERIDIERYLNVWRAHHGTGSVSLITARGCPYHCNWCSHSVYGKTHRRRSPKNVVEEVEWILGRYHPDMLWLADDVFTIHHGWLFEYAAEMQRRRIPFAPVSTMGDLLASPHLKARGFFIDADGSLATAAHVVFTRKVKQEGVAARLSVEPISNLTLEICRWPPPDGEVPAHHPA